MNSQKCDNLIPTEKLMSLCVTKPCETQWWIFLHAGSLHLRHVVITKKGSSLYIHLLLSRRCPHQNLKYLMDCWLQECTEGQLKQKQVNNILTDSKTFNSFSQKVTTMRWCSIAINCFRLVKLFISCFPPPTLPVQKNVFG